MKGNGIVEPLQVSIIISVESKIKLQEVFVRKD